MSLDPSIILAVLVGVFHASLYVLIRGSAGGRLPIIVVAAILGAWAGDALGDRLGIESLVDRRLPAGGGVDRRLGRDRGLGDGRRPGPDREGRMSAAAGDRVRASFVRGLTLGALVGAIIAGSSLWSRHRRRQRRARC